VWQTVIGRTKSTSDNTRGGRRAVAHIQSFASTFQSEIPLTVILLSHTLDPEKSSPQEVGGVVSKTHRRSSVFTTLTTVAAPSRWLDGRRVDDIHPVTHSLLHVCPLLRLVVPLFKTCSYSCAAVEKISADHSASRGPSSCGSRASCFTCDADEEDDEREDGDDDVLNVTLHRVQVATDASSRRCYAQHSYSSTRLLL